jgi:HSP20 family protein
MALVRWSPFEELTTLHTTMDRLFGDMAENYTKGGGKDLTTYRLPVDIAETDNGYLIKSPVPGFKPEEVEVSLSDGVLTIAANHKEEKTEKKQNFLRREVAYGNFERMIALPNDVQGDNIKATFNNGVLEIEVPRAPKPQPKKIEVRAQNGQQSQQGQQGQRQMAAAGNSNKT